MEMQMTSLYVLKCSCHVNKGHTLLFPITLKYVDTPPEEQPYTTPFNWMADKFTMSNKQIWNASIELSDSDLLKTLKCVFNYLDLSCKHTINLRLRRLKPWHTQSRGFFLRMRVTEKWTNTVFIISFSIAATFFVDWGSITMSCTSVTHVIQITNLSASVNSQQMRTLFTFLGDIEELRLYPPE